MPAQVVLEGVEQTEAGLVVRAAIQARPRCPSSIVPVRSSPKVCRAWRLPGHQKRRVCPRLFDLPDLLRAACLELGARRKSDIGAMPLSQLGGTPRSHGIGR